MPDRFYCPSLPAGDFARLEKAEAHHLARVLRKSVGDRIEVFNGNGLAAVAEIRSISKQSVELAIRERSHTPPPAQEVILACAVPKGDRFRWLVEKAVELNVSRFLPLLTERSIVKPGEGKQEKMMQVVIESCKQCRRNHLMVIQEPKPFERFLNEDLADRENATAVIAHPAGKNLLESVSRTQYSTLILIVGPEGGFTDWEVERATAAGAVPVGLGPNILRIETAALAMASFAALAFNQFSE